MNKVHRSLDPTTLFVMKPTDAAAYALKKWLQDKDFNTLSTGWKDKRGNPGISLSKEIKGYNNRLRLEKRGVIICIDDTFDKAIEIVEQHLGYGEEA